MVFANIRKFFSESKKKKKKKVASSETISDLIVVSSIPRLVLIYVSELVPISYQLWLQRSKKKQEEKHNLFIQNLYEQNDTASSDRLIDTDSLLEKPIN